MKKALSTLWAWIKNIFMTLLAMSGLFAPFNPDSDPAARIVAGIYIVCGICWIAADYIANYFERKAAKSKELLF